MPLAVAIGECQHDDIIYTSMPLVVPMQVVEAGDTDIVAFDFYSRFQRPTAPACDRFAAWQDKPTCKRNRLRW